MKFQGIKKWILFEWLLVACGIGLHLRLYFLDRPLLPDGMNRVAKIMEWSYREIFEIGHNIYTVVNDPVGILLVQKFIVGLLGSDGYAVRLFLVFCSIASILLFKKLKNWFVDDSGGMVALALFVLSRALIKYSVIFNSYGSDVLVTLLLYVLFIRVYLSELNKKEILYFGCAGALSVWFSLPAIFVLSGGFLALAFDSWEAKKIKKLLRLGILFMFWALSFGVYYFHNLRYFTNKAKLLQEWNEYFLPLDFNFFSGISWFAERFYGIFIYPVGVLAWGGIILFLLGAWSLWKKHRVKAMLLILPFFMVVLAACLRKHPLGNRTMIFLLPSFYLLIGSGWSCLYLKEREKFKPIISLLILVLLFAIPIKSIDVVIKARSGQHPMIMLFDKVKSDFKEGDIIYVHWPIRRIFAYFNLRYGFKENQIIKGKDCVLKDCHPEIDSFKKYNKIWMFSRLESGTELESFLAGVGLQVSPIPKDAEDFRCHLHEINPHSE